MHWSGPHLSKRFLCIKSPPACSGQKKWSKWEKEAARLAKEESYATADDYRQQQSGADYLREQEGRLAASQPHIVGLGLGLGLAGRAPCSQSTTHCRVRVRVSRKGALQPANHTLYQYQNGAASGFEMYFCYFYRIPAPLMPGVPTKTRLESRFCNKEM